MSPEPHYQAVMKVADHSPCSVPIDVRRKDGSFTRVPWLGMYCEHAVNKLPGVGFVKIRAHEITPDDGCFQCNWRRLESHEYVLGWRVYYESFGKTISEGVYGVVDNALWPIVIGQHGLIRSTGNVRLVS